VTTTATDLLQLNRTLTELRTKARYNSAMARPRPLTLPGYLLTLLCLSWSSFLWSAPTVKISSDDPVLERNLEAMLDVRRESCQLEPGRQRVLQRNLQRQAILAAQAVGYYSPEFNFTFSSERDCWSVFVKVDSGPPVRIHQIDIILRGEAEQDQAFIDLIDNTPLQQGEILRHNHYQSLRDGLLQLANQRGYFDNRLISHRLEVDPSRLQANVLIEIDTGRRHRFGDIILVQEVLRPEMARLYLRFDQGDFWNSELLLQSQQALLGSGYFTTARLERGTADPDTLEVPATLHLSARPQYAWLAGIGVSTDTGPRLRLGFENRYVNENGHRWRADSEISPLRFGISTGYEIPLADPVRDRLALSASYQQEETDSAETEQLRLGASLISELFNGWVLTRSLDFERENFTVGEQRRTTELLMPGAQIQRIRSTHPIYPRRGWKFGVGVRGTHPSISTTNAFLQTRTWGKAIIPIGEGRLLSRVEYGQTAVDDVTTLPASVRFFAGGDTSIRGFDYQTLGPVNSSGDVIGGRSLLVGSAEFDYPLWARWHPAVFVDGGNAFNDYEDLDIRVSIGAGIRWRSPLGPIRIDLARPIDDSRNWRLHLSMGPDL
jgi:translocation and assembly module TamA